MTRPDVLMLGPMLPDTMEKLDAAFTVHKIWEARDPEAALREVAPRIRGIALSTSSARRADTALFDLLPALEIIAGFGVGYDNVDAAEAGRRGIIVTNTPDVLND
ncbi:MAG: 2-hydroxyacid dehydrogenase, partial [Microvirga sp.]